MRARHIAGALAFLAALWRVPWRVPGVAAPAQAQDSIYVPLFTYRTGPFAASGIAIANGMHDYLHPPQ